MINCFPYIFFQIYIIRRLSKPIPIDESRISYETCIIKCEAVFELHVDGILFFNLT